MTNRLEDHPRYAEAVAWAEEHGFGGTGPSARGILFTYLSGYDEGSKGVVSADEAHEIGYSKGHYVGFLDGVQQVGSREQWGVYYEEYSEDEKNFTYQALNEAHARGLVAASPTDRGLRRRFLSEWEQVD